MLSGTNPTDVAGGPAATAPAATVVLVHGAWADGSSWSKVIPLLQAKGLQVLVVQNPLTSLADDVAATKRTMLLAEGKVVLVGHSWGGTVITEAGIEAEVAALVYVAALANSEGQSGNDLSATTRRHLHSQAFAMTAMDFCIRQHKACARTWRPTSKQTKPMY